MNAALPFAAGTPLDGLLEGLPVRAPVPAVPVSGLALDSRRVTPGCAFLAVPGTRGHGLRHGADALARGAGAILYEGADGVVPEGLPAACAAACVPLLEVPGLAAGAGALAARFYGLPAADLHCIGVTGTDGKTSVARFLTAALDRPDARWGVVGTLGAGLPERPLDTGMTTPDAVTLQGLLADLRDAGANGVVMEVSSHALVQQRVAAVPFAVAVLTQLGRDHLDYHADEAAYAEAKAALFRTPGLGLAVLNRDDAFGRRLHEECTAAGRRVVDYSASGAADAAILGRVLEAETAGLRIAAQTPAGDIDVTLPLLGRFNADNILAVVAVLAGFGLDAATIEQRLARITPVPGRMEPFTGASGVLCVVDYAHTAGALGAALEALRPHTAGALWCVFGCGGNRDPGKRPLMAAAAEAVADHLVLTSDNPRDESPEAILAAMRAGLANPDAAQTEPDREAAIRRALASAAPGDTVLIAGKGHETTQVTARGSVPFSDRALVADLQRGSGPC